MMGPMSAIGPKQTSLVASHSAQAHVCIGPNADVAGDQSNDTNLCRLYRRCVGAC